ncbi:MAG TPA: TIGR01777 family oxidoreductase [Thioalkalivibrio sp.]|nr:TIGR01777 family oxidoreductase [Thioalkalivibrio sp.]
MRILVSGGTGFIGQVLCPQLTQDGHDVIVWSRQPNPEVAEGVTTIQKLEDMTGPNPDAVINLAGASIADGRWTEERKRLLVDSRVDTTGKLVDWMRAMESPPKALISASAVGYYGEQGDRVITEETAPTSGFTHDLCEQWENEALKAESLGVRVCLVRTGVVLDRDGGALAKMLPPFKMGAGGRLGSGEHYFPWIHRADIVGIYQWLVANEKASGPYNAGAPNPVTNAEFTRALGSALKRPTVLPMPEPVLRLLFGEMSEILLVSNRMMPTRLLDEGFKFRYPELKQALQAILQ